MKLDDVIEYIIESEKAAERVQPQRPPEFFREQLSDECFDVPDVLTITDVSYITGYTPNAVDKRYSIQLALSVLVSKNRKAFHFVWVSVYFTFAHYSLYMTFFRHVRRISASLLHPDVEKKPLSQQRTVLCQYRQRS